MFTLLFVMFFFAGLYVGHKFPNAFKWFFNALGWVANLFKSSDKN